MTDYLTREEITEIFEDTDNVESFEWGGTANPNVLWTCHPQSGYMTKRGVVHASDRDWVENEWTRIQYEIEQAEQFEAYLDSRFSEEVQ